MHLDILMKCAHAVSRLKIVSRCDGMHHFKSCFALLVLGNLKRVEPITSSHGLPKRHDVELGVDQVHPSRACTHPGKCPQSDQWKFFKATLTQALLAFMQMLRGCIMRRTRPKPLLSPPDAFKQRIYVIILIYAKTCPNQAGCEDCHVQSIRSIPVCKLHLLILFRRQWLTYHCAGPRILCCAQPSQGSHSPCELRGRLLRSRTGKVFKHSSGVWRPLVVSLLQGLEGFLSVWTHKI